MPRIRQLLGPVLIGIAVVSIWAPRLLDYTLGVVFLAGAAQSLLVSTFRTVEGAVGSRVGVSWQVTMPRAFGLFGGGSIAWGWMTASRVTAGGLCLALIARAALLRREQRDVEGLGCGVFLGAYAATAWLGLFSPYLEGTLWPGTPAGRTANGVGGYLVVWMAGLALVGAAVAGARWWGASGTRWAAIVAVLGFGVWLGGALYCCGSGKNDPW